MIDKDKDRQALLDAIASKDSHVLCREVLSIGDTMDVLRNKWTVEILTAILCGNTRFKDILAAIHGLSDKVLTERLRQMLDDHLVVKRDCRGYPPRVEYELTDHAKDLYVVVYRMTEWGSEHRRLLLEQ